MDPVYTMQLDLHTFARLRPYLYHVTALENLSSVRRTGRLEPASALMRRAGRADWSFADFIEYMNDHVFFWPGTDRGPVKSRVELPYLSASTSAVTFRIPFDELLAVNPAAEPLFCTVNSSAPREDESRRVSRGPHLFRSALTFSRRPGDVVEVAFRSAVTLPSGTTYSHGSEWVRI